MNVFPQSVSKICFYSKKQGPRMSKCCTFLQKFDFIKKLGLQKKEYFWIISDLIRKHVLEKQFNFDAHELFPRSVT